MTQRRLDAWNRHGTTLFDIALAAPQVIAHRTARMIAAGPQPNARDRREFTRMGQEKLDAVGESLVAMNLQLWRGQQAAAMAAFQTGLQLCTAPWSLWSAAARPPAWHQLAERTLSGVMGSGMKPVHRRVTANAKRLAAVQLSPSRPT
jgi:hypothetical protein